VGVGELQEEVLLRALRGRAVVPRREPLERRACARRRSREARREDDARSQPDQLKEAPSIDLALHREAPMLARARIGPAVPEIRAGGRAFHENRGRRDPAPRS
jgi:hypothetical protein